MRPVKTKVKIWFKSAPQRLSRDSQFLTASSKWFVWVPPHLASYSINVLSCPRTHRITLISIYQTFRIKVLHSLPLYKLLNLVEYILWRISLKICLHCCVGFLGDIGLHTKSFSLDWKTIVVIFCTRSQLVLSKKNKKN